jgi:hypothetical protein
MLVAGFLRLREQASLLREVAAEFTSVAVYNNPEQK